MRYPPFAGIFQFPACIIRPSANIFQRPACVIRPSAGIFQRPACIIRPSANIFQFPACVIRPSAGIFQFPTYVPSPFARIFQPMSFRFATLPTPSFSCTRLSEHFPARRPRIHCNRRHNARDSNLFVAQKKAAGSSPTAF